MLGRWQEEGRCGLSGPGAPALRDRAFTIIRALLLFSPPAALQRRVLEFYSRTFSVHMSQEDGGGGACPGCVGPAGHCWCQEALGQLQELSGIL